LVHGSSPCGPTRYDKAARLRGFFMPARNKWSGAVYIQRSGAERMTLEVALKRYLSEISPTKKPITQHADNRGKVPYRYIKPNTLA
jgi:hypothetical protein